MRKKKVMKKKIRKKRKIKKKIKVSKKTASSKSGSSKSASKARETLKKSAKSKPNAKKEDLDDILLTTKMSELIDDSKEYKSKTAKVIGAPKPLPMRKNVDIKGYRNQLASGIFDQNDRRKAGFFMRNASVAFDTLG